jgi:hypothetical protein
VLLPALVVPEIELSVKSGVGRPANAGPHGSPVNFSCRRTQWSGNQLQGPMHACIIYSCAESGWNDHVACFRRMRVGYNAFNSELSP